jgi:hypothetical protein
MFGRVPRMNRVDCVRKSLRLALQGSPRRRSDRSFGEGSGNGMSRAKVDYRASAETLGRKLGEAGTDAWQLLVRRQSDRFEEQANVKY